MNAEQVVAALLRRHPEHEGQWLCLREVFNIDLLALSCWQGKGPCYERVAYEVKVSWADFKRELADPWKRRNAVGISHRFLFAAPSWLARRVRDEGMLPPECGLVEVREDGGTRLLARAPVSEARTFTERELVTLLRWTHLPSRRRSLLWEAQAARTREAQLLERVDLHRTSAERARRRLAEIGGGLVERGSSWRGPWPSWGRGGPQEAVVKVAEVRTYPSGGTNVVLTRHGGDRAWPGTHWLGLGEFLADYEPAPDA